MTAQEKKDIYSKWKSLVNMSANELEKFLSTQEGKDAGLSVSEARKLGINSGRTSAKNIIRMKRKKFSEWNENDFKWAKRQISFISRMRGNKGGLYDEKGEKTRKHTSLLLWGHNPKKAKQFEQGGDVFREKHIYLGKDGGVSISGQGAFEKAVSMDANGIDSEVIRKETGWFKNKFDNLWRYEISDEDAAIDYDYLERAVSYSLKLHKDVPFAVTLNKIYKNELLFKAYQNISNLFVAFSHKMDAIAGVVNGFDIKKNKDIIYIQLNTNEISKRLFANKISSTDRGADIKSILTHELQHIVQIREGLSGGSSLHREREKLLDEIERGVWGNFGISNEASGRAREDFQFLIEKEVYKRYFNSLGEIESKDVEQRICFDKKKRIEIPPYSMVGFNESDIVVNLEDKTEFEEGSSILPNNTYYHASTKRLQKIEPLLHVGSLATAEKRAEMLGIGNDVIFNKVKIYPDAKVYKTTDTIANIYASSKKGYKLELGNGKFEVGAVFDENDLPFNQGNFSQQEIESKVAAGDYYIKVSKEVLDEVAIIDIEKPDVLEYENEIEGGISYLIINPNVAEIIDLPTKLHLGGDMSKHLAPNGQPSNLTHEQWHLVRSQSFKNWFGDWENDPENASKVVDENGEPLVVYHGTARDFNIFKTGESGALFFSNNKSSASRFSEGDLKRKGISPKVLNVFLNIRKYYDKNSNNDLLVDDYYENYFKERPFIKTKSQKSILKDKHKKFFMDLIFYGIVNDEPKKYIIKYNYDGIVIDADNNSKSYIAFYPNQIKLADGTNTTFDGNSPDIRFEQGGEVESLLSKGIVELNFYDTTTEHAKEYRIVAKKPLFVQNICVDENERLKGIGKGVLDYLDDYARKNGNDVIFGHIAEKALFTKDSRQSNFCDVDMIKNWLHNNGYAVNNENNDFHKIVEFKDGGEVLGLGNAVSQIKKATEKLRNELIEKIKAKYVEDGVTFTSRDKDYYELILVIKLYEALGNYLNDSDLAENISVTSTQKGISIYCNIIRDGKSYKFETDVISAGGYNIQSYHYRYIIKTQLPKNKKNILVEPYLKKIKALKGIEKLDTERDLYYNYINQRKESINETKRREALSIVDLEKEARLENPDVFRGIDVTWETIVERGADKNYESKAAFLKSKNEYKDFVLNSYKYKKGQVHVLESNIKEFNKKISKVNEKIDVLKADAFSDIMKQGGEVLKGGNADGLDLETIALLHGVSLSDLQRQFEKGVKVEMEHTDSVKIAREISLDHLAESPVYYDLLESMERKFESGGEVNREKQYVIESKGFTQGIGSSAYKLKRREELEKLKNEINDLEKMENNVKPIRQLGTGANVYFETEKYRVNDNTKGGIFLLIQNQTGLVPVATIEFPNANEAIKMAKKLNEVYPNGVPDALMVEKYVNELRLKDIFEDDELGLLDTPELTKDEQEIVNAFTSAYDRAQTKKESKMEKEQLIWFTKEAIKTVPTHQLKIIANNPKEFQDAIYRINKAVADMPETYETDGIKNKMVYLHYFSSSADWYIVEKDSLAMEEGHLQDYGYADLGYGAELGYISIQELKSNIRIELDLYFEPKRWGAIGGEGINTDINAYKNAYDLNRAIEALIDERGEQKSDYTAKELEFLSYYSGYGGLHKMGDFSDEELKTILYEYYTPDEICKKMWALAYKYGYGTFGDKSVFEPSVGIGNFLKYAPSDVDVTANEINKYSATIASIFNPNANILLQFFERNFIKNNLSMKDKLGDLKKYSLVIGNPPYGSVGGKYMPMGEDKYSKARNWTEYFIFRGLDLLHKDGLLIYIVGAEQKNGGTLFLDSEMTPCKEKIAEKAVLLDAYRLPVNIFERTGVSSEIIVLQKK